MPQLFPDKGESKVCEVCRIAPMEQLCTGYLRVKVSQRCVKYVE